MVSALLTLAALADIIAPESRVYDIDLSRSLKPPSWEHPFGTDHLGRDVFARVIHGIRIALKVIAIVVAVEVAVGVPLGVLAGYCGGKVERVVAAVTDTVWAFPPLVLALGIVIIIGPSITTVAAAIALVSWAPFTKTVQGKTRSIVSTEYVEAAKALGAGFPHIVLKHVLPNVAPTVLVLAALTIPYAVLSATSLSFLGLGAQPPQPDWGLMVSEGRPLLITAPWVATFPGLFIALTALGFNLVSDGLRDVLDPKLRAL